jgi:hypothetical protein
MYQILVRLTERYPWYKILSCLPDDLRDKELMMFSTRPHNLSAADAALMRRVNTPPRASATERTRLIPEPEDLANEHLWIGIAGGVSFPATLLAMHCVSQGPQNWHEAASTHAIDILRGSMGISGVAGGCLGLLVDAKEHEARGGRVGYTTRGHRRPASNTGLIKAAMLSATAGIGITGLSVLVAWVAYPEDNHAPMSARAIVLGSLLALGAVAYGTTRLAAQRGRSAIGEGGSVEAVPLNQIA